MSLSPTLVAQTIKANLATMQFQTKDGQGNVITVTMHEPALTQWSNALAQAIITILTTQTTVTVLPGIPVAVAGTAGASTGPGQTLVT